MKGDKKESHSRIKTSRIAAYHEAGHALATKLLTDEEVPKGNNNSFNIWRW